MSIVPYSGSSGYYAIARHIYDNRQQYGQLYNKAMPYLRGSIRRMYKPRGATSTYTNALAIRYLQRQVNRQKPEVQYFFSSDSESGVTQNAFHQFNYNPLETLANAANRGDLVLGDTWINKYLEIRCQIGGRLGFCGPVRLIVYRPLKANTTVTMGGFTNGTDPNQMSILHDEIIKPYAIFNDDSVSGSSQMVQNWVRRINLRNMKSTFTLGGTAEKNNVRVALLLDGEKSVSTPTIGLDIKFKHAFTNK